MFKNLCLVLLWVVFVIKLSYGGPANILFVLTDDQDVVLNGLTPMTKTLKHIASEGVTFLNAFVNSPICCPSRSSILTGKHLHHLNVRNNSISGNCASPDWQRVHERHSMAAILKSSKNYRTFYAGKYLNQYGSDESGGTEHVPMGYDWWIGLKGNSRYYNYTLSINGTAKEFEDEYLTDVIKSHALDFLANHRPGNGPFFMTLAPPAAHAPFTPAPRHAHQFPDVTALRTPSFNHTPTNKHWLLQLPPLHLPTNVDVLDDIQRHRLQTLLAVDEMVDEVLKRIGAMGLLDDTFVVFTSDNGFHIGQFGLPWDKRQPYETDIRVPLLVRGPGVVKNITTSFPVSSVDIAPTLLEIAGVTAPSDMDGVSFLNQLRAPNEDNYNRLLFVEYYGEGNADTVAPTCPWADKNDLSQCNKDNWCKCQDSRNNTYACVRHIATNINFKYCQFMDEQLFVEAYNLATDPHELDNIAAELSAETSDFYVTALLRAHTKTKI